ncbi:MAG: hypothetical protein JWL87_282 [Candidatus Adlerbacteria bacterium]|nr:hypothetical protein [Candidatus Adlerbacteria bacterium]
MKKIATLSFSFLLLTPLVTQAACISQGSTVVYINGIFTNLATAQADLDKLRTEYRKQTKDYSVDFINGYNESHLAGAGDLVQSVAQMMGSSVSGYDLNTILLQIHPQITTRKVLLVGHSQGAFYANALYDYFLSHGAPRQATGVYAIGTPALSVADGGGYLNSTNDTMLNTIDAVVGASPLSCNITLPVADADKSSTWPGHGLSRAYLAEGADRVVGDIKAELDALKSVSASETGECFTPPAQGIGYQAAKAGFVVADTTANGVKAGLGAAQVAGVAIANAMGATAAGAFNLAKKVASDAGVTAGGLAEISQAADGEHRPTNFDIFSKLYGSSLTKDEYVEFLGSAVATAPVFAPDPEPVVQETVESKTPETKIIYLGNARGPAEPGLADNAAETPANDPVATTSDPVASTTDPVATTTPLAASSTPSALAGTIVISELSWGGTWSDPADQWIELYNRSNDDIDLASTSLVVDSSVPVLLAGTIHSKGFVVIQRVSGAIRGGNPPEVLTINFGLLGSDPSQLSLIDTDGKLIDATPAKGACGNHWCAGSLANDGYADAYGNATPVSMERIDAGEEGTDPDNWASNDGFTIQRSERNQQPIVGTPGAENSKHWPVRGFFCGEDGEMLLPGEPAVAYEPGDSGCTALMGAPRGISVGGSIFVGEVGSSTELRGINFPGRFSGGNRKWGTVNFSDPEPGEYFVGMWEYSTDIGSNFSANRIGDMYSYLKTGVQNDGTSGAPNLNYVVIPFIIEGAAAPAGLLRSAGAPDPEHFQPDDTKTTEDLPSNDSAPDAESDDSGLDLVQDRNVGSS